MKSNSLITYTSEGHVAYIDPTQAFVPVEDHYGFFIRLHEMCLEIAAVEDIWVVVFNRKGRPFQLSLPESKEDSSIVSESMADEYIRAVDVLAALPQPVLSAMDGDMQGIGLELTLACDLRIAGENARFKMNHLSHGEIPFLGGTQRLARLIGKGKALEMVLTGEAIDAGEAMRIGLINKMAPSSKLPEIIQEMATILVSKGPIALAYTKEAVNTGMDMSLEQGLRLEADLYFLLHTSRDRTEGIQAFQQKRKPDFEGR
jgi:enoyl-CoA hydratase